MTTMRMALAAAATLGALTTSVSAQDWPTRPITLIVPFAPGGGVDASARLQALAIGEVLGQTIVIETSGPRPAPSVAAASPRPRRTATRS